MAAYKLLDFADIIAAIREELKVQSTDTTSINRIKRAVNMVYLNEVVPAQRWKWLYGHTTLTHKAYYGEGTVAVTPTSTTVTLSAAPSTSVGESGSFADYLFSVNSTNEIYRITAHTAEATTLTIDRPFNGTLASAANFKIWKDEVALPTDARETTEIWHDHSQAPMEGQGLQEFRRAVALQPKAEGRPIFYSTYAYKDPTSGTGETESDRYRVVKIFPSICQYATILKVDYVREASALENDGDEPLLPIEDRIALFYGALSILWRQIGRSAEDAAYNRQLFNDKLASMKGKIEDSLDKPTISPDSKYMSAMRAGRVKVSRRGVANVGGGQSTFTAPTYLSNVTIAGATITSNVTVNSGITVDGRDLSADGATLDSLETDVTDLDTRLDTAETDIDTLQTDLAAHLADTADAHDASAISVVPTGNLASDNAQDAFEELQTDVDTRALDSDLDAVDTRLTTAEGSITTLQTDLTADEAALAAHIADTADAHDASAISVVPAGNLAADDVQEALEELQTDVDTRALDSDLDAVDTRLTTAESDIDSLETDVADKITNPMDAIGQLIYGGASGVPTKLDAGTEDYPLFGAGAAAPQFLPSVDPQAAINYSLSFSVASNALTIALKDAAGNDPSSSSPCKFAFRDADENTGKSSIVKVTSALSLTVPSGATLGSINFTLQDYYVFVLNNAGTVELAVMGMNAPEGFISGYGFGQSDGFTTTVAISSSADNAHEMYSDSARTGVPYRLIGRFRATQNTAGAWAGNPTYIQLLPIARSLEVKSASGASTVGSSSGSWVTPSGSVLILTPGVWRLRGFLQFFRNGGTSNLTGILGVWSESTNASVGIGTGSNFTDLAGGISGPYLSFNTAPEMDAYILNAADKLILVKRTASIYYNVQLVAGTPANFTFNTGIWAERVL